MGVEIDVVYTGQLHTDATHGPSKAKVSTDAPVDNGGKGESFSPTDLVATALGTCMLTIIGLVAERNKIAVKGTTVHVTKEMSADAPRRIAKLTVVITFPKGLNLTDADKSKFAHAAKTCPVHHSLHPDIQVPVEYIYP